MQPMVKETMPPRRDRVRPAGPRGQAMVEYSVIAHFILLGGGMALVPIIFGPEGLFEALNRFYDSVYFVLSTGAF
jgi:hypothetical protein